HWPLRKVTSRERLTCWASLAPPSTICSRSTVSVPRSSAVTRRPQPSHQRSRRRLLRRRSRSRLSVNDRADLSRQGAFDALGVIRRNGEVIGSARKIVDDVTGEAGVLQS